jgi:hypothetical protein
MSHTPGPWSVGKYDDTLGYDCMTGGISVGPVVLDGADYGQKRCGDIEPDALARMQADARLIAASPDLLDALKLCYEHCALYHPSVKANNVGEAVRAAIAKAEGGEMSDTPRTDAATHTGEGEEWQQADAYRLHELSKQLERELTAALKDAERYRWLRERSYNTAIGVYEWVDRDGKQQRAYLAVDELDESVDAALCAEQRAIDAAIAAEKPLPPA